MFLFKRNQNECGLTCEIKSVFFYVSGRMMAEEKINM